MRKWFLVLGAMLLVGAGVYYVVRFDKSRPVSIGGDVEAPVAGKPLSNQPPRINGPGTAGSGVEDAMISATQAIGFAASTSSAPFVLANPPLANEPEISDPSPMTVLENMRSAIRLYGSTFGGNPVGNNQEITRALNGANPKKIKFLKEESGMRINAKGELVDSWGTPFFFHQLSGKETEIHSAGPDRVMWTADDLVIR